MSLSRDIPIFDFEQLPAKIRHESSNFQVKLFLFKELLNLDETLSRIDAWNMVKRFVGTGDTAFIIEREMWIKDFGEHHGHALHVVVGEQRRKAEETLFDRIYGTLARFSPWPMHTPPSGKDSNPTNLNSPNRSQSPAAATAEEPPLACSSSSSSSSSPCTSLGMLETTPTWSTSSGEQRDQRSSGGPVGEKQKEGTGLRSRSGKGRVFDDMMD